MKAALMELLRQIESQLEDEALPSGTVVLDDDMKKALEGAELAVTKRQVFYLPCIDFAVEPTVILGVCTDPNRARQIAHAHKRVAGSFDPELVIFVAVDGLDYDWNKMPKLPMDPSENPPEEPPEKETLLLKQMWSHLMSAQGIEVAQSNLEWWMQVLQMNLHERRAIRRLLNVEAPT